MEINPKRIDFDKMKQYQSMGENTDEKSSINFYDYNNNLNNNIEEHKQENIKENNIFNCERIMSVFVYLDTRCLMGHRVSRKCVKPNLTL